MLKLIGVALVMASACGMLFSWEAGERARIGRMKELQRFLGRTYYAMQTEHVRIIAYAQQYRSRDEALENTLRRLAKLLMENTYATGELAWNAACGAERKNWGFGEEAWELLLSCGTALFGRNLEENLYALSGMNKRIEKWIEEESCAFAEKRKVLAPVGLLGGVMLIVILL